ncbi:hypothetical protein V8V91_15410 [Algoriphagus halophilus]|uniref:hypothetical protein n=1 Tax=Algoriphagus halophilus TaxID=226505 RepID=UPI00358E910C
METYVMEPMIQDILGKDPELKKRFDEKMESEEDFAASLDKSTGGFMSKHPILTKTGK